MTDATTANTPAPRFLRIGDVMTRTALSRPYLYRMVQHGRFPRPLKVGAASAWLESEVTAWMAERVAERDGGEAGAEVRAA